MHPNDYGQWYYLIYLLPGGVALLLLLLSSIGGGGRHHRVAGGHGRHMGGGGHSRHMGGGRTGGRSGVKHHHAKGPRGKAAEGPGAIQQLLAFFGVGRLPGPFVWGSALLGWGLFGFWGTRLWEASLHYPALFVLPALATALIGSLAVTKLTAEVGGRLMPQEASSALSTIDLCGQTGTVAFPVTDVRGRVNVYDSFGTLHTPAARVKSGDPTIMRGRRVLVTDYDSARDTVIVEEIPA